MTAFVLTLAIAIMAFYYIWSQTAGYGKTVEGVYNFYCVQNQLDASECAAVKSSTKVSSVTTESCGCFKETEQRGDRTTRSLVITQQVGTRFGKTDYATEIISSGIDATSPEAACDWYCRTIQPQTDITKSYFACYGSNCRGMSYEREI